MSPHPTAAPPLRYSAALITLHWLTAALMLAVVVLAWIIPGGPGKDGTVLLLHRSVGLTILALSVLRLGLRAALPVPAESEAVSRLESLAARVTHWLLYAVLFAMPASGFLWTTSRGTPASAFGLFTIPPLFPASDLLEGVARTIHSFGQYAVYAMVGLHAAAALYHLVVRRDDVMARILPGAARAIRPLPAEARPAVR